MPMNNTKEKKTKFAYLKQLLNGEVLPSKRMQFFVILILLGVLHIVFSAIFLAIKFYIPAGYSLFSAYLYLLPFNKLLKKDKYLELSIIAFAEITFFSIFCTFLAGPNWGFGLYNLALTPIIYFITYSIPNLKRSLVFPTLFGLISGIVFIAMKIAIPHISFIYDSTIYPSLTNAVYIVNAVVVFAAIMILSSYFALEIRYKENSLEKQKAALEGISSIDPLTGLKNRRSMLGFIEDALQEAKSKGVLFSLAIGDIDNFKMVNDTYGHNIGDDVLIMVSNTIKDNLPENATLCRWGGEEFLLLIKSPESVAVPQVDSIRDAITKQSIKVELPDKDIDLSVTMTFGVSQYIYGFDINKVIACADDYLYKGKAYGKNRVVYSKTEL